MSMRSIAAGALALAFGANNVLAGDGGLSLTILHINDAESQLLGLGDANEYGDAARWNTSMADLKVAYPTNLVITSGDNFLAGPEFNAGIDAGVSYDALALGAAGFDALCLGNQQTNATDCRTTATRARWSHATPQGAAMLCLPNASRTRVLCARATARIRSWPPAR